MKSFMLRRRLRICCRWKNRFRWNYFEIKTLSQVIVCNIKWWNFLLIKQPRSISKGICGCGRKDKLIDCTLKILLTLTHVFMNFSFKNLSEDLCVELLMSEKNSHIASQLWCIIANYSAMHANLSNAAEKAGN